MLLQHGAIAGLLQLQLSTQLFVLELQSLHQVNKHVRVHQMTLRHMATARYPNQILPYKRRATKWPSTGALQSAEMTAGLCRHFSLLLARKPSCGKLVQADKTSIPTSCLCRTFVASVASCEELQYPTNYKTVAASAASIPRRLGPCCWLGILNAFANQPNGGNHLQHDPEACHEEDSHTAAGVSTWTLVPNRINIVAQPSRFSLRTKEVTRIKL